MGENARRRLRFSKLGVPIEWEEEPFEWVRPYRFSVVRRYRKGPVAEMRVFAELRPQADGGTLLVYEVWARPKNLLGFLAIPVEIGVLSARRFTTTFRSYDRLARGGTPPLEPQSRPRLVPGGERRIAAARQALLVEAAEPDLVERLTDLVERGDDLTLARLRPYVLAEYWAADRRAVLELCLHATRAGLLELRWDLLCPLCRGAKQRTASLNAIDPELHCDACRIDFAVNFDHSVELTFRPSPSIREVDEEDFCVGGPEITPHIVTQQLLGAGNSRLLALRLERGRYRLRTLELRGAQPVLVSAEGLAEGSVRATGSGWSEQELHLGEEPRLTLENPTDREQLFVLERIAWSDQAVTAAEVTALQLFRDLFSTEALRPREPISVGTLTVLFTDLRDSTRFYREVGDPRAFGSVMDHLDVLRTTISVEGGAVVKAMGDAVMAVFSRPAAAVRAALGAQRTLASPPEGQRPLLLKAGIHSGPCIAVNQNERLDYFGSTVNLAARLVDFSSGRDLVVSEAVLSDPEVGDLLAESGMLAAVARLEAPVKGFDEDRPGLWRIIPPRAGLGVGGATSAAG